MESSEKPGFSHLSRELRDRIYQRVLYVAHPLYLFTQGGSNQVELFAPERPVRWLALLYTNRQVHTEASATLYRSHKFVMVDTTHNQANLLQFFLNKIGSVNAGHLTHICINFPAAGSVNHQV